MQEGIKKRYGQLKNIYIVMSWVKETIEDKIIIRANIFTDVYTFIDASYAVDRNMRSHTGGSISIRHGLLQKNSLVQRLNTKISTKAELVGES